MDWFTRDKEIHSLSQAPEPKRRFMPSKWEEKKCALISVTFVQRLSYVARHMCCPFARHLSKVLVCQELTSERLCRIVKLVRALRKGWIKTTAERAAVQQEVEAYLLWEDDGLISSKTPHGGELLLLIAAYLERVNLRMQASLIPL